MEAILYGCCEKLCIIWRLFRSKLMPFEWNGCLAFSSFDLLYDVFFSPKDKTENELKLTIDDLEAKLQ
jgi:hypothetical protein